MIAPSGAGKSTITRALLDAEPALSPSISMTTRLRRPGEQDGVHYHYTDAATFEKHAQAGLLLEWAWVHGQRYGTPRAPVEAALHLGRDVIFDIDWQGWRQMKAALPADAVGVFILPPSLPVLASRLRRRASDNDHEIMRRLAAAREEITHWPECDHVVVNDDLQACIAEMRAALHAARSATARATGAAAFVGGLLDDAREGAGH